MLHTCQVTRPRSLSSFRVNPQEPGLLTGIASFPPRWDRAALGAGGGFEGEIREVRPELETSRRIDLGGGRKEAPCEYFCSLKMPVG